MEYAIKIIGSIAVIWFMIKLIKFVWGNLSGTPLWLTRYQTISDNKRKKERVQSLILGLFFLVISVLMFTFEQETADYLVHVYGILIGILGLGLIVVVISLSKKMLAIQINNPDRFTLIRKFFAVFFSVLSPLF